MFLDTGYHFAETIGTRDAVEAVKDVNVITLTPRRPSPSRTPSYGKDLHDRDPDLCCALRKVEPLDEALDGYERLGDAAAPRRVPDPGEHPGRRLGRERARVKISPIARWTQDDVDAYVERNGVLINPLLIDGYASVGCAPCTRRVGRRGPAPAAGPAGARPNAGCTCEHRH